MYISTIHLNRTIRHLLKLNLFNTLTSKPRACSYYIPYYINNFHLTIKYIRLRTLKLSIYHDTGLNTSKYIIHDVTKGCNKGWHRLTINTNNCLFDYKKIQKNNLT